jgi:uncharacterized alpha/beta hydrolase family protein
MKRLIIHLILTVIAVLWIMFVHTTAVSLNPAVTSYTPADQPTDVAPTITVTAIFSELNSRKTT